MADKSNLLMKRKEKEDKEATEVTKDVQEVKKEGEKTKNNGEVPANKAAATGGAVANDQNGDFQVQPIELPPFEIITGDRIDPFIFKFQFKNVEYSSGRNKTILCYLVHKEKTNDGLLRGYLEDEHTSTHAEEAFFTQCLPDYDPALKYTVTWYVTSSPCSACAKKIAEVLRARKNVRLTIFSARLFWWEEAEIQAGLRALHSGGCKLRIMKPLDFSYMWDTFVENDEQPLNLWEDCKENYEYYHEKLADILQ
ncbi:C-_U-editing enzyme APOBEC-2a isoform X2 [Echeneis naucrates]|uniref:Probable C->U-editing enzyme APOBEC-2 n=1 Tax=Echeneis naucrates TaxID=173247 RepID=A0A665VCC1_ECHNA|nr:probable C->U-editing enzyme APOBEC-2 isoform X2 [Echeneis naucrates]